MRITKQMITQFKNVALEDLADKAKSQQVRKWASEELRRREEMKANRPLTIEDYLG